MKLKLAVLILLLNISCTVQKSDFKDKYSTESAREAVKYAKALGQNQSVSDADWELLFKTEGYQKYLNIRDSLLFKQAIKDGFTLSFDKSREVELDSLLSIPIQSVSRDAIRLLIIANINELCGRLDAAQLFLDTTAFEKLLDKAHQKVKEFLPEAAYSSNPALNDLYFICGLGDASVRANSVFFDLNLALSYTEQEIINVLAHEFHHNYRDMIMPGSFKDPLLDVVNSMHAEGVADLINKEEPPFEDMAGLSSELVNMYNVDFSNTPQLLQAIDSLTLAYVRGDIDDKGFEEVRSMVKYGGHANGHYMALLIKNANGMRDMISTYDDPVAFIKLYNKAAAKHGNEHVFSSEFIDYLEKAFVN